ncbi:MAG: tRNA 2-thiouridine(34) synthase MnmA, partial [Bacteroides sp.]
KKITGCCNLDTINDARILSYKHGFKHYVIDIKHDFKKNIVDNFIKEYFAARTPNPCVLCNTYIKWDILLEKANILNCEYIATGHYANIKSLDKRYVLSKGIDHDKDQSYFLWGMSQDKLKRTKFPLGQYTKDNIKSLIKDLGYKKIYNKKESYEICFIPDNNYRNFLHQNSSIKAKPGNFILSNRSVIGQHKGYPFYTIGQRKNLGISVGYPLYVIKIYASKNEILLGPKSELYSNHCNVNNINMVKYNRISKPIKAFIKIRYRDNGNLGTINSLSDNKVKITFDNDVASICPGQSAVFYENNDVIGGGFIE